MWERFQIILCTTGLLFPKRNKNEFKMIYESHGLVSFEETTKGRDFLCL